MMEWYNTFKSTDFILVVIGEDLEKLICILLKFKTLIYYKIITYKQYNI